MSGSTLDRVTFDGSDHQMNTPKVGWFDAPYITEEWRGLTVTEWRAYLARYNLPSFKARLRRRNVKRRAR